MSYYNLSNFRKVCEFNKSFGLPHYDKIQRYIREKNPSLFYSRFDLCFEKLSKLNEAFEKKDLIEIKYALADELYVTYGAGSSFGIDLDTEFSNWIYQRLETSELEGDTNYEIVKNVLINEDTCLKVFSAMRYLTYNKNSIQYNIYNYVKANEILKYINDEIALLKILMYRNDIDGCEATWEEITDCLCSLLYYIYEMSIVINIDLDEVFTILHESNMSKLCKSEEEAKETVKNYKENDTKYHTPIYRKSYDNNHWVVYNESDGEILKSINYIPINEFHIVKLE